MASPRITPIERIRPNLPPAFCRALGRALRADPDERVGARDMLDVLRAHVESPEARARLADELGRMRREAPTLPDEAPVRVWVDPDATIRHAAIPSSEPSVPSKSRPQLHTETPTAIVTPVVAARLPPPTGPSRRWFRALLGYALVSAALLAPLLGVSRIVSPPVASAGVSMRTRGAAARGTSSVEVRTDAPPSVPSDPALGALETPSSMANHRVFVDGLVRGNGGDVLEVRCGLRAVRLGSAGRIQWIRVPCGGRVSVEP